MILCDLCGQPKECLVKEIEGREYDICHDCWNGLAAKLTGKGRSKKEVVLLPTPEPVKQKPEIKPPHIPPKIWGEARPN